MMDWTTLEGILPADRDAVILALAHGGYKVGLEKRKDGNKTVTDIVYTRKR